MNNTGNKEIKSYHPVEVCMQIRMWSVPIQEILRLVIAPEYLEMPLTPSCFRRDRLKEECWALLGGPPMRSAPNRFRKVR